MADNRNTWHLLPKEQWYRLEEFLARTVGEGAEAPDPLTSDAIVLEDETGAITAVFFGIILLRLGPFVGSADMPDDLYGSALTAMREVFASHGLEGEQVLAFEPGATRDTELAGLGFVALPLTPYVGVV